MKNSDVFEAVLVSLLLFLPSLFASLPGEYAPAFALFASLPGGEGR